MVDMAVIFGAERPRAAVELLDSLRFQIALAKVSFLSIEPKCLKLFVHQQFCLPNEKRRDATLLYNPFTLVEAQEKWPYLPWVEYINALLPKGLQVDEKEVIIVGVPNFFDSLGVLLKNTPKRTLANYMMWRIHSFSSFFLTEELRKLHLVFNTAVTGQQEQVPRWKECIDITSGRYVWWWRVKNVGAVGSVLCFLFPLFPLLLFYVDVEGDTPISRITSSGFAGRKMIKMLPGMTF